MKKSQIVYSKNLPHLKQFPRETILFYDKKAVSHRSVQGWAKQFPYKIALNAGESLKSLDSYAKILKEIQKITQASGLGGSQLTFIALGGGSVGDFVGFLAATYQRGRKLVSIPSTWLAAIDSAHGGKTGLNLNGVKNQVGAFYPAETVYICESLLKTLPNSSLNDAYAEALKIGVINQPKVFLNLQKNEKSLFQNLPHMIAGKYAIVKKDPLEQKGIRKLLNLGHTVGHVFESLHKLPHGQAVFFGMLFSLRWSLKKKLISWYDFQFITEKLFSIETALTYQQALKIPKSKLKAILLQDKKKVSANKIDFIFVKSIGKVALKTVTVDEILKETERQLQEL